MSLLAGGVTAVFAAGAQQSLGLSVPVLTLVVQQQLCCSSLRKGQVGARRQRSPAVPRGSQQLFSWSLVTSAGFSLPDVSAAPWQCTPTGLLGHAPVWRHLLGVARSCPFGHPKELSGLGNRAFYTGLGASFLLTEGNSNPPLVLDALAWVEGWFCDSWSSVRCSCASERWSQPMDQPVV